MNDLSQLEVVAYIIYSSKSITEFKDKYAGNYIDKLEDTLLEIDSQYILNNTDLRLFNNFEFRAKLDFNEIINYSKLIFDRLLNHFNKEFNAEDILKESKFVFYQFSIRTAKEEVKKKNL